MKHLIIYAHPVQESFNHRICQTVQQTLEKSGHTVAVRDLYALNFDPVLSEQEMADCYAGEAPKEEVLKEQQYILDADSLIFIYPIWWAGMPAILKGYIDRVFSYGFAYAYNEDGQLIRMLTDKHSLIINTHGSSAAHYDQIGMTDGLRVTAGAGILEFVGTQPVGHLLFGDMDDASEAQKEQIIEQIKTELSAMFATDDSAS
ncbi:NAD(P)H-dependent oxidoreductase [Paenibacillus sp. PDC88]|uniref:NAD(P)H-dependent oxidoreductase n=1 Tax=Paenibacillus sp. PDC88 TaxID=1884375 RepID=UPI00089A6231|nr:NAD(P)H-dependent oxidoreductase [Paenibacillus sp. PDC88]SDW85769.1 NAD(P)H dehydrogenase (quinone) [Paenibacillus sp. PDC88]